MKKTIIAMTVLAVLGSTSAVFAQAAGGGGGGIMAVCGDDLKKFCPDAKPRTPEFKTCLQTNMASFSDTCKQGIAAMRAKAQAGGMQGGAGGAAGGGQ